MSKALEAFVDAEMELESLLFFCNEAQVGNHPSDARELARRVGMALDKLRERRKQIENER